MIAVTHILFLSGGNGRNAISGAERHVLTLVHELASRGVDTELVVLLWNNDPQIERALAKVRARGVRVCVIERRRGGSGLLSRLVRALDCWRRLGLVLRYRRDRVVHMHMELVMQVIAARVAGCRRLVMTIHNDEPLYRRRVLQVWFSRLAASGMRFIAITDHVRQYLVTSVRVRPASVTTIKYGVPAPVRRAASRFSLGLTDTDFVVGFVGRLTPQKNIQLLIRAMAIRPDLTCLIVGEGELRSQLEQLARTLGCSNVRFLGAQSDAAGLMPLFDVLCLPSLWEGLGLVLVEAMLQDVPIVASRAGAIPEVLDGGRCGALIDPSVVSSLVDALDAVRTDPARRHALVRAARERAATVYGVGRMGDETCSLYGELCGNPPSPAASARQAPPSPAASARQAPHRVCFVATGLARGGAEQQLFHAATGLLALGFDVHVVCILSPDYYGPKLEQHGVPVTCLNASRTTSSIRILTRFLRCVKGLDPVALVGVDYPGAMLARAGGALARIPVVISSIHTENNGGAHRRLALAWTDRLATVTTAVSQRVAQTLVDMGVPSTRVQVIPNGIDTVAVGPHLRADRAALRRSLGIGEQEFFWFAAGRLEAPKDYPNLLAAMALLAKAPAPVRLAIAGHGPLLDEIRGHVSALGLDGVVSLLGLRDDVPACMAAADATVLASAWEGLPTVALESLAVETPIVCTDVGGVREIVENGRSGFVVPSRNPEALAAAMSGMMACSEEKRRQMGASGRKHIENNFALDRVVGCWSGLLNDLVGAVA